MYTRAKFTVVGINKTMGGTYKDGKYTTCEVNTVKLIPVTGTSEENKKFFASTPSGAIELGLIDPAVAGFELNKEYYIDFIPAE